MLSDGGLIDGVSADGGGVFRGASQAAPSSEVVKKQKCAKLRLYTGPCPNMQVRNVNDTFSDLQDSEDEEDEDDEQEDKGNEEVENENVEKENEENEDEENENDDEDHGVGNKNETEAQENPKRKYVPRGPTRMSALGLTNGKNGKEAVSFNNKDRPIGDPSVQLASVLGVLVRRNIALKQRDWRLVPKESKDNIWAVVQQRWDVILKRLGQGKSGRYSP
ncbi:nucleoplasmin-like protein ANO39 [Papaver somniferum]|uniref:nucleoplasmin-like protein ANO39 n=1 Tax=Papaver somniferum TaxID=3469 RepID=UPI000E6FD508|nr:nucleoplasmin-like protein ANO39 [Papaver somniferum]